MNEKFFDLKKEKQDRMINAALKVFAQNGYRHASTDEIVAEANISKGLLFHYFINKLGLYTFLYDYSNRFMALELNHYTKGEKEDFFILFQKIETAKLQVLKNYPYMQLFLDSIKQEDVKEALLATEEKKNLLPEMREAIMSRADVSRFRKEADPKKIKRILEFTIQGMMEESFVKDAFQPDMINHEIKNYVTLIMKLSYF